MTSPDRGSPELDQGRTADESAVYLLIPEDGRIYTGIVRQAEPETPEAGQ
jgi:hypothetical protein